MITLQKSTIINLRNCISASAPMAMPKVRHFKIKIIIFLVLCLANTRTNALNANQNKSETIIRRALQLTDVLAKLTEPYIQITFSDVPPSCVQMQCKFVCFNGRSSDIARDIKVAASKTNITCATIEELRIYNYYFTNNTIPRNFLGEFGNQVEQLYIASSNVSEVEGGAFAKGIFQKLYFENLQLRAMREDFFKNISSDFYSLTIIQKDKPLESVASNFLSPVKYQIKYLSLQVGITCIRNLTSSDNLLNNLAYVDFSYNSFSDQLAVDTFSKLSMVEHLDLSHSNISYVPDYIFADFTTTLIYLDLSHNKLTTISRLIFGWRDIKRDFRMIANDNVWNCNCALSTDMKEFYAYQSAQILCTTPEAYRDWSVFDDRLCGLHTTTTPRYPMTTPKYGTTAVCAGCGSDATGEIEKTSGVPGISTPKYTIYTTGSDQHFTTGITSLATPPSQNTDIVQLECKTAPHQLDRDRQGIQWPKLEFVVRTQPSLSVEVLIQTDNINEPNGLVWFSKVTKQYYKMEINYNEYGLGCYGNISYRTTVENLLPNVAYTFCLVLKDQLTISPFSCKSIHVAGNLDVTYSAWLTNEMRITGISLVVLAIVIFTFLGIVMVFLTLKQKPTLLKGSKRVATTKGKSGEIVVFPKDKTLEEFRYKEQMLAKRNSKSPTSFTHRRGSTDSNDSNQSYMNANLYEMIPAYIKLTGGKEVLDDSMQLYDAIVQPDQSYMQPLSTSLSSANLVSYAEIPYRSKRVSNDPLPEVPQDQAPYSLPLKERPEQLHGLVNSVEYSLTLDSQV